ncbi:hypothetical protein ACWD04_31540 [Streptomyces sp. NPDC002911]
MEGEHSAAAARNADNICKLDHLGHYWTDGVNDQRRGPVHVRVRGVHQVGLPGQLQLVNDQDVGGAFADPLVATAVVGSVIERLTGLYFRKGGVLH